MSAILIMGGLILFAIVLVGGVIMSAIGNLQQAIADLNATIGAVNIPVNQDADIQAAADSVGAANVALKAKVGL